MNNRYPTDNHANGNRSQGYGFLPQALLQQHGGDTAQNEGIDKYERRSSPGDGRDQRYRPVLYGPEEEEQSDEYQRRGQDHESQRQHRLLEGAKLAERKGAQGDAQEDKCHGKMAKGEHIPIRNVFQGILAGLDWRLPEGTRL